MNSRALRLPSPLADDLCRSGEAAGSESRDLPPEILDAALLAKDVAAAVVLVNASRKAYRRIRQWLRSFTEKGGSVSIYLQGGIEIELSQATTDGELDEALNQVFDGNLDDEG
jgi:hypothetical protein